MSHPLLPLLLLLVACAGGDGAGDKAADDSGDTGDAPTWQDEPEVCDSPALSLAASGDGYLVSTDHYQLQLDGFDEAETRRLATLAELSWTGFAAYFGAEASGPMDVTVSADEASFEAALVAAGIGEIDGAGGYYDPNTGRAYLYRQPTTYYSRVLLLHEMAHQYQDQTSYTSGLPFWYVEGVAEALSRHHWDGDCLQLRVRPLLSWEDAAASAAAALEAGTTLNSLLSGESGSRPLAQELVRLLSGDPAFAEGFQAWRDAVAAGTSPTDLDALAETVAPLDSIEAALADFVPEDQEPMAPVYLDWVPQGDDAAWGFSSASSVARVKAATETFSMATDLPDAGENVGTLYGYDPATGDHELAFVSSDGTVSRFAVIGGAVTWDLLGSVTLEGEVRWSQAAGADETTITIGADAVTLPRTLPAAGGLSLYAADAEFWDLSWE